MSLFCTTSQGRSFLRSAVACSALASAMVAAACRSPAEPEAAADPVTTAAPDWNGRFEGLVTTADLDPVLLAEWWTTLNDPLLTELIQTATSANLDLRAAGARLRQARGQRKIAAAGGAPQVGASAAGSRFVGSANAGTGGTGELFSAGIDASWEVDVFGGIEKGVQAADADVQTAQESRRDVLISIVAEVALSYSDLRAIQSRRVFVLQNLELQESTLGITHAQFDAGAASELDVSRVEEQLASLRASLPTLDQQLVQTKNRIAVLLGKPPGSLSGRLDAFVPMAIPKIEVALGVPAQVLRRRPDVRLAERRLAAESARLGVAIAELYPKFSLVGSIGLESLSLTSLFEAASGVFNLGPRVQWTPFDGGRLRAQVEIQEAVKEETLIAYEAAVLLAIEEVENAVSAYAQEHLRHRSLEEASRSARRAMDLTRGRFDEGATNFLDILDAQRRLVDAEDALASSAGEIVGNLIRLYKALGGGWDPEEPSLNPAGS